jgi:DNA-binding MarR family transcriptional regulator
VAECPFIEENEGGGDFISLIYSLFTFLHKDILRNHSKDSADSIGKFEYGLLGTLSRYGELSFGEAAEKLMMAKPQLTVMSERMAQKGYVERIQAQDDRRVWRLRITDSGRACLNQAMTEMRQRMNERFASLSEEEMARLKDALAFVRECVRKTSSK